MLVRKTHFFERHSLAPAADLQDHRKKLSDGEEHLSVILTFDKMAASQRTFVFCENIAFHSGLRNRNYYQNLIPLIVT